MEVDGVFEGGGGKIFPFVGAAKYLESQGVKWGRLAGVSAGAIFASLLAAGYTAGQVEEIVLEDDFSSFRDLSGDTIAALANDGGLYSGDQMESWLSLRLGNVTMSEIPLTVFTYDIQNKQSLRIDSSSYPDMLASKAVRMSASIPVVFQPVRWLDEYRIRVCVDGGIVNNYPISCFDDSPERPVLGFIMEEAERSPKIRTAISVATQVLSAVMSHRHREVIEENRHRTIPIPIVTTGLDLLQFERPQREKQAMIAYGADVARTWWESHRQITEEE